MDSSAPNILPPRVRVPSTPSMLLSFIVKFVLYLSCEKNEINKKRPGLAHFKIRTKINKNRPCVTDLKYALIFNKIWPWSQMSLILYLPSSTRLHSKRQLCEEEILKDRLTQS